MVFFRSEAATSRDFVILPREREKKGFFSLPAASLGRITKLLRLRHSQLQLRYEKKPSGAQGSSNPTQSLKFFSGLCSSSVTPALALMTVITQLLLWTTLISLFIILGPSITSTYKGLTRIAEVVGSNPAQSLNFFQVSVLVVLRSHMHNVH